MWQLKMLKVSPNIDYPPEDGRYINSSNSSTGLDINGLNKQAGIARTIGWLMDYKLGQATINYKIRDWLFSRQRYWGEPFPVIHWEDGEVTLVDEQELPVRFFVTFLVSKQKTH